MLTKKDYCDYDTCVALKELGYDEYCAAYYHLYDDDEDARNSFEHIYAFDFQNSNNIYRVGAPLLYQAQKWLREIHNIFVMIDRSFAASNSWHYVICINDDFEHLIEQPSLENYSYEEALSEGIKEACVILKEEGMI